jgi:hypothetical protein
MYENETMNQKVKLNMPGMSFMVAATSAYGVDTPSHEQAGSIRLLDALGAAAREFGFTRFDELLSLIKAGDYSLRTHDLADLAVASIPKGRLDEALRSVGF